MDAEKRGKVTKKIDEMLFLAFGYFEVEKEVLNRCLAAIDQRSMEPLKQPLEVFCPGDFYLYRRSKGSTCLRLYEIGVWEYVKSVIEEEKNT